MLIVRTIGSDVGRYYLGGPHPGWWSPAAGRALGLYGEVRDADLRRVLQGRHPASGRYLPAVRPARRRAGYDLVFAAPKSVSLLGGDAVRRAHHAAVEAVLSHLETEGTGLIRASFGHTTNAAGQPHLHTHVLVANLVATEQGWRALRSKAWETDRVGLTALYQLDLRHQLQAAGYRLDWRLGDHGLADLAAVPRSSVRAASAQATLVGRVGRVEARRRAEPAGWVAVAVDPGTVAPVADAALERRVATRLGAARSDFRQADVWSALAACYAGGMPVASAKEWAARFCDGQEQVDSPTLKSRWATPEALRLDAELRDLLVQRGGVEVQSAGAGETGLLAHAEALADRVEGWRRDGAMVVVDGMDQTSGPRWRALTGLDPRIRGQAADVVVVDGADRRTSAYLLALARSTSAQLVLLEGGTRARLTNPASHGLRDAGGILGRSVPPAPEPWRIGVPTRDGPAFGRHAAERLLGEWQAAGRRGLLVGLGTEETAALNQAARAGRDHFAVGEPVVAQRYAPGLPRHGTIGTIHDISPLTVEWSDLRRSVLTGGRERHIGPAWAVTASVAARLEGRPLHILGRSVGLDVVEGRGPTHPRHESPGLFL